MSLQFIAGPSGCGKSYTAYREIIRQSQKEPDRQFLVIVPEQFTMQTQKEILEMHPKKGLLNIDVLSFNRLAYRVFEETGGNNLPVLEDTGKSLVVRHVISEHKSSLRTLSASLSKQSAAPEMSSLISELLQYKVAPEELDAWISAQEEAHRGKLAGKLVDVQTIYQAFLDYLEGHYLTTEEVPQHLCEVIDGSVLVRDSVIVLDGFTGFTPVQDLVVDKLLRLAGKVTIVLTCGSREELVRAKNPHSLFHMSREMYDRTRKLAQDSRTEILPDIWIGPSEKSRFASSPALSFIEENLFRYRTGEPYAEPQEEIKIVRAADPASEMRMAAEQILRMVREEGYRWRDFAIVTGDLETYGRAGEGLFREAGIPYFLDEKKSVLDNPAVEFIRAALDMEISRYSYESVFRFLRSGMTSFTEEEADDFETYVLALGIKGWKKYDEKWIRMPKTGKGGVDPSAETEDSSMLYFNGLREKFVEEMREFHEDFHERMSSARRKCEVLYRFIVRHDIEGKLKTYEERFSDDDDEARAKEYSQMYRAIMDLLDKVARVLGDEKLKMREYQEILDAGFQEIAIGVIPPGEDQVMIGDIERTRLKKIRVLFFVGINDGIIPKPAAAKGILSEPDRDYLKKSGAELSPTARELIFQQRFYLYLSLTKPSDHLYLSFSATGSDGEALAPSYLIGTIQKLFADLPVLEESQIREQDPTRILETPAGENGYLLEALQAMPAREMTPEAKEVLRKMMAEPRERERADRLLRAKSASNKASSIGQELAEKLYGRDLNLSVTRLEEFANCPFAHFMDYGLRLHEREIFEFQTRDFGTIMHEALRIFSQNLKEKHLSWRELSDSEREELADRALDSAAGGYGNSVLLSTERNHHIIDQIREILQRTVWALQKQIEKGSFEPTDFEFTFGRNDSKVLSFGLGSARMNLYGKIDRLDTCDVDGTRYLKVIDYKTGNENLDLNRVSGGIQLQLAVYMKAAEAVAEEGGAKSAEPAGIFYYQISDPLIDEAKADDIDEKIMMELRPNGLVRSELSVQRLFDKETTEGKLSDVLPSGVKIGEAEKKGGEGVSGKSARDKEDFDTLSRFVTYEVQKLGKEMMEGDDTILPAAQYKGSSGTDACTYCGMRGICGYDERIAGFHHRRIGDRQPDDVLREMREALSGGEKKG